MMVTTIGSDLHLELEELLRKLDAVLGEAARELRSRSRRLELAADAAVVVDAELIESEDVLRGDDVAFHADDLGHGEDAPRSVAEPRLLDDHVERAGDHLADVLVGEVRHAHADHRLE